MIYDLLHPRRHLYKFIFVRIECFTFHVWFECGLNVVWMWFECGLDVVGNFMLTSLRETILHTASCQEDDHSFIQS